MYGRAFLPATVRSFAVRRLAGVGREVCRRPVGCAGARCGIRWTQLLAVKVFPVLVRERVGVLGAWWELVGGICGARGLNGVGGVGGAVGAVGAVRILRRVVRMRRLAVRDVDTRAAGLFFRQRRLGRPVGRGRVIDGDVDTA